jgi:hypothetical protein
LGTHLIVDLPVQPAETPALIGLAGDGDQVDDNER